MLAFTLRWTLLISATTLLLFLLTPRRDNWSWQPLNKLRAGYRRSNQGTIEEMNLNNTGRVELDDAIALRVAAADADGQPKLDLPAEQLARQRARLVRARQMDDDSAFDADAATA